MKKRNKNKFGIELKRKFYKKTGFPQPRPSLETFRKIRKTSFYNIKLVNYVLVHAWRKEND